MQISTTEKEAEAFFILRRMLKRPTHPHDFFHWIADRLINENEDNPSVDFIQALREYARDFSRIDELLRNP